MAHPDTKTGAKARQIALIGGLVLLFAAIRYFRLGTEYLWLDEVFTRLYAMQPWSELREFVVQNDSHPPAYFAFVKLFSFLGNDEYGLRFASWLLGSLALVFAGLSVTQLGISQDARSYVAMVFAMSLCCWALAWIAANARICSHALTSTHGRRAIPAFATLAIGTALLPWLHNVGVMYGAAVGLAAFAIWLTVLQRNPVGLANLAIAGAVALALWAPHLPDFLRHSQNVSGGFWLKEPTIGQIVKTVMNIFGNGYRAGLLYAPDVVIAVAMLALGAFGVLRLALRRQWPLPAITAGIPALVFGAILFVTFTSRPIFLDRLLHPATVPWLLLLAYTVATITPAGIRNATFALVAAALAFGQISYFSTDQDRADWPVILATIDAESSGKPMILTLPNSAAVLLEYHAEKLGVALDIVPGEGAFPMKGTGLIYPTGWPGVPGLTQRGLARFETAIDAAQGDVWLMLRGHWLYDPDNMLKRRLDQDFCYQLLKLEGSDYFYFVKLIPHAQSARMGCDQLSEQAAFPYMARRDGDIKMMEATN